MVMFIYATLYHYFATGPFMLGYWYDADSCEDSWWYSLLYINNFFNKDGYVRSILHVHVAVCTHSVFACSVWVGGGI